jgi:hypothetical protein
MLNLPKRIIQVLRCFEGAFSERVWEWAKVLLVPEDAPIVVGSDETIERRRGAKIAAKGISRDPVRSSKEFFVKTSGLRWMSMLLLTPIPWAQRV